MLCRGAAEAGLPSPGDSGVLESRGEGTIFSFYTACRLLSMRVTVQVFTERVCHNTASVYGFIFWLRGTGDLSSLTRDRTHAGGQRLSHWATRDVPWGLFSTL